MADATTCRVGIDAVLLRELLYRVIVVAYDEERVRRSMAINDVIMYLNLLVLVEVGFGSILDVVVECEHGLTRIGHPHLCAHNETAVSSLGGDDASAKTEKRRRTLTAILDGSGDGLELLDHGRRVVMGHHVPRSDRHKVQALHLSAGRVHLCHSDVYN
jgi:hypothetical protein